MTKPSQDFPSDRFQKALNYALELHGDQVRKYKGIPYYAHLMSVTALVLESGGDEEEAMAALLHDAVEDQGGRARLQEIEDLFGSRVAAIVDGCTDAYKLPKPPWRERKEKYLQELTSASRSVILVSLADKVHNARSIYRDLRREGGAVWDRFTGGKEGTLWYYRSLGDIFRSHRDEYPALVHEFLSTVEAVERLAQERE